MAGNRETYDAGSAEVHLLQPGGNYAVPPGRPHRVSPMSDGWCRFLIVQGVGTYDSVEDG